MQDADYYRQQAERARRLSTGIPVHPDIADQLRRVAQDYDDIATDLETGAIAIRHPELTAQQRGH